MLPILRIIPVGGVLLALAILVLALRPPVGPHAHLTAAAMPARGPLIAREEHPEWRQFLILAALRRADALSKLRDLPDTPTRTAPVVREDVMQPAKPAAEKPAPDRTEVAGVHPGNTQPDDITGSVQAPDAVIPVDIGESSSAELPVIPHKERPPVIMMPARETSQPGDDTSPQPAQTKPQRQAAPASAKQASREVAPPIQPEQENKALALAPVPLPQSKPAALAKSKQASREPASVRVEPKRVRRRAVRQRARSRHSVRVARRAHRAARKQDIVPFDLFSLLFGFHTGPPGGHVEPTSMP